MQECWDTINTIIQNSVGFNQTPRDAASDRRLHCFRVFFLSTEILRNEQYTVNLS